MADRRPALTVLAGGRPGPEADAGPTPPESSNGSARNGLELTALGTGLLLTTVLMARLPSWSAGLRTFQALFVLAFAFYSWSLFRSRRVVPPRAAWLVFTVAAACRLALLPVTPTLSDDIYRYVWEGTVAAHGHDPYRHSPQDPILAPLRDRAIHPHINHPELASIYPPLSIAGFAVVSYVSPTVLAMKTWVILNDLAMVLVLLAWARARRLNPMWVTAYAWNPLVLIEYSGSGHHDPCALVWLVAALWWAERNPMRAAVALAAGVLTKLAPLVALPFLMRRWPWRARVGALAMIVPGLAWYGFECRGIGSGLVAYGQSWANNELLFHYLARIVHDPRWSRVLAAVLLVALGVFIPWRRGWEAERATRFTARAGFLLSPVAHPWYLGWVLAFEPMGPSTPWLLLSLTAILSYGILAPPQDRASFHLPLLGRWFEYGAPLALAAALALARRSRGPRRTPA